MTPVDKERLLAKFNGNPTSGCEFDSAVGLARKVSVRSYAALVTLGQFRL